MQVRTQPTPVGKSAKSRFSGNLRLRATALGVLQLFAVQAMLCGPSLVHADDCSPPPGNEASDPDSAPASNAVDDGSTDSTQSLSTGTNDGGNDGGDSGDGGGSSANVSGTDGSGTDPSGSSGAGSGGEGAGSSDSPAQDGNGGADTSNSDEDSDGQLGLHGFLDLGYASSPLWQFMKMLKVHDPIDVSLADKQHVQIDYVSGGAAPLRLSRSYHSNPSVNTARVTVPMGTGWHHFYDRTLQVISANQVRLHRANGRTLDFTASGSTWSSALPAGVLTQVTGGWQYVNHRDTIETYESSGRLLSMSSGGLTTALQYNAGGQLVGATNPFGRAISFAYDASGRLNSATLPGGGSLTYTYDGRNNLVGMRFADGALRQYVYENASLPNALTGVIDESGRRRLTWRYDTSGRPSHGHYGSGSNSIDITYAGGTVTTTDARGTQRIRTLGTVAGRTVVTAYQTATTADSPATNWSVGTDAAGNPASLTTNSGEVQQFSVDSRGRPTAVTRAAGTAQALSVQRVWHPIFRKATQITAAGVTHNVSIDALGRITSISRTAGGATATVLATTYNAQNLPQTITDARGATTTFTYDTAGNRATMTNALGQVTSYSNYTAHGQPGRIQRADGVVGTQTFDARGRVASRTIAGLTTSFAYDPAGRVTTITLPDGSWRSVAYDTAGKVAGVTNHRSESASVSRDVTGLPTNQSVYAANGTLAQTVAQRFNSLGRIAAVTDSRGYATQFTYAADARPLGATDALGLTRTVQLDLLNRKTALTQPNTAAMRQITGNATATSTFGYDSRGNFASVNDVRSIATNYGYNTVNQHVSEVGADAGQFNYMRNAAGDVTSATDPRGLTFTRTPDALGRITAITPPTGSGMTYGYVAGRSDGLLSQMTDPSGSTTWTYDSAGRVLSKAQLASGGVTRTVTIARDSLGRPSRVTYPSGTRLDISYSADTVASLTVNGVVLLNNISYRPFSQTATAWRWGNGSSYSRAFDADGRVTGVTLGPRTRGYSYDAVGQVTGTTDQGPQGTQVSGFTYDEARQLTGYNGPQGTRGYAYDANGNRLSQVINGVSTPYTYVAGTNRLAAIGSLFSFSYNVDGSATSDGAGRSFTYDTFGRSSTVTQAESFKLGFDYNGLGQRVSKLIQTWVVSGGGAAAALMNPFGTTSSASLSATSGAAASPSPATAGTGSWVTRRRTHYVYDDSGHMIGEYDTTGGRYQDTIWFNGQQVAVVQSDGVYYVHGDNLGTPRSIVRPSDGAEVWRWDSEPFGANSATNPVGSMSFNQRFPGQYLDVESGIHYNGMRDYQPATGRYLQADPIGLSGGTSRYAYVRGNPISNIDPTGLLCNWTQSTGSYSCYDPTGNYYASGTGYAGAGADKNNPGSQNLFKKGPLPKGCYKVSGIENGSTGPYSLRLMPLFNNDATNSNRDLGSFLIHGDSVANPGTASEGCPIMPRADRRSIPLGEVFCVN